MMRKFGVGVWFAVSGALGASTVASCSGSGDAAAGGVIDRPSKDAGSRGGSGGNASDDAGNDVSIASGGSGREAGSSGSSGAGGASQGGSGVSSGPFGLDVWIGPIDGGPPPLTTCRDLAPGITGRVQFDASGDKLLLVRSLGPAVLSTNPWKTDVTFGGHRAAIQDAALSPDGTRGASVGDDGMLREWDATTGAEVASIFLEPPRDPALGGRDPRNSWKIAFLGSGEVVVTRSAALRAYDWGSTKPRWSVVNVGDVVTSLAASPDGQSVALAMPLEVALYRSSDGHELARVTPSIDASVIPRIVVSNYGPFIAFSPEGSRLAWAASNEILIFDPNASLAQVGSTTVASDVLALAAGPNADWVLVSSFYPTPSGLRQIRMSDGSVMRSFGNDLSTVSVSGDGRFIASGGQALTVYDASDGSVVYSIKPGGGAFNSDPAPLFSPTQAIVAFWTQLWNLDGSALVPEIAPQGRIVGFDPSGEVLVVNGSSATATYFDAGSTTPKRSVTYATTGPAEIFDWVSLSPDGSLVAAESPQRGHVRIWSAATGAVVHEFTAFGKFVESFAWSVDASMLAIAGTDALADGGSSLAVKVWRTSDASLVTTLHADAREMSAAFSPDGALLATSDDRGRFALWALPAGTLVREIEPTLPIAITDQHFNGSVAFSSNGKFIASRGVVYARTFSSFVAILRVSDASEVMRFWSFGDGNMGQIGWSPDDRYIGATSSEGVRIFCVPPLPAQ